MKRFQGFAKGLSNSVPVCLIGIEEKMTRKVSERFKNKEDVRLKNKSIFFTLMLIICLSYFSPLRASALSNFRPEAGVHYRIVNKFYADRSRPALLDADSATDRVYRSGYESGNTQWTFVATGDPGFYRMVCKFHSDKSLPALLDADSGSDRVYRSGYESGNTQWTFVATGDPGFYRMVCKFHSDRSLPAFLDADSGSDRVYRSPYECSNTQWRFIPDGADLPFILPCYRGDFMENQIVRAQDGRQTQVATGIFYNMKCDGFMDGQGLKVAWTGTDGRNGSPGTRWAIYRRDSSHPPQSRESLDWTLVPSTDGFHKLKNREFLDGYGLEVGKTRTMGNPPPIATDNPAGRNTRWMIYSREGGYSHESGDWTLLPLGGGAYQIKNRVSMDGRGLEVAFTGTDGRDGSPGTRWMIYRGETDSYLRGEVAHFGWQFIPTNYMLQVEIKDFAYTTDPLALLDRSKQPVSLVARMSFPNKGNATLEQIIDETRQTTNTASWSFEESTSLHFSDKCTVYAKASASFLGFVSVKGGVTNVFEWDWKKDSKTSQSKTFTETKTHHIQQKITIPPHTCVEASCLINWAQNVTVPFTASVRISALADRLRKDGTVARAAPVSSDVLNLFLRHEGYQGRIVRTDGDAVYAEVRGTLTADVGFDTIFSTRNIP